MKRRGVEHLLTGPGSLEIQMRVVFPGKTHATVQLDGLGGTLEKAFAGKNFRSGRGFPKLLTDTRITIDIQALGGNAGSVVTGRARAFDGDQIVRGR